MFNDDRPLTDKEKEEFHKKYPFGYNTTHREIIDDRVWYVDEKRDSYGNVIFRYVYDGGEI